MSDSVKHARNITVLLALAAVVTFVPGGGRGALVVGAVLSIVFACGLALVAARFYQEHRIDLYALGDGGRAILYGSLAAIALVLAGSARLLASDLGTLAFVVVIALSVVGLMRTFQASRDL